MLMSSVGTLIFTLTFNASGPHQQVYRHRCIATGLTHLRSVPVALISRSTGTAALLLLSHTHTQCQRPSSAGLQAPLHCYWSHTLTISASGCHQQVYRHCCIATALTHSHSVPAALISRSTGTLHCYWERGRTALHLALGCFCYIMKRTVNALQRPFALAKVSVRASFEGATASHSRRLLLLLLATAIQLYL
jgi:hypothetical protein